MILIHDFFFLSLITSLPICSTLSIRVFLGDLSRFVGIDCLVNVDVCLICGFYTFHCVLELLELNYNLSGQIFLGLAGIREV